jgi:protein tyrosine phosphatase (PTP) superfamily phosphohydrolase (DUF442 family)
VERDGTAIRRSPWSRGLAGGLLMACAIAGTLETGRAWSHADEKLSLPGVSNFGRVAPGLYRGGQPDANGFVALKQFGVQTVLSFTFGPESTAAEARQVRSLGMDYVNIPWSAYHEPTKDQVAAFFTILDDRKNQVLFLHCWQGADRTGVMVALYRIQHDGWSAGDAIEEMKAFHYHFLFQPHLQRFVEAYAASSGL